MLKISPLQLQIAQNHKINSLFESFMGFLVLDSSPTVWEEKGFLNNIGIH
jgi:hypothetical protein